MSSPLIDRRQLPAFGGGALLAAGAPPWRGRARRRSSTLGVAVANSGRGRSGFQVEDDHRVRAAVRSPGATPPAATMARSRATIPGSGSRPKRRLRNRWIEPVS